MGEGGLGTLGALEAATAGGAQALGTPELGRLTPGSVADLVAVEGDPLSEIRLLLRSRNIRLVLRDGIAVAGRDLDRPRLGAPVPSEDQPPSLPTGPASPCAPRVPIETRDNQSKRHLEVRAGRR